MANSKANQNREEKSEPRVMDAVRHVGPTLEQEGLFIPAEELPEMRIENEALPGTANVRTATEDEYDQEAGAMGAEPLKTRLPGDRSSEPHTDAVPENDAGLNDDGMGAPRGKPGRAA